MPVTQIRLSTQAMAQSGTTNLFDGSVVRGHVVRAASLDNVAGN